MKEFTKIHLTQATAIALLTYDKSLENHINLDFDKPDEIISCLTLQSILSMVTLKIWPIRDTNLLYPDLAKYFALFGKIPGIAAHATVNHSKKSLTASLQFRNGEWSGSLVQILVTAYELPCTATRRSTVKMPYDTWNAVPRCWAWNKA